MTGPRGQRPRRPSTARPRSRRPDAGRSATRRAGTRSATPGTPASRSARRAALSRRRARAALLVACAFAAVVLVTSLPLRTLLQQRADVATTAATVRHLDADDRALAAQAAALADPATVRSLAHSEFDYVQPGDRTFDVVPPTASGGTTVGVGHVQLDQPVALPGTAASAQAIGVSGPTTPGAGGTGSGASGGTGGPGAGRKGTAGSAGGYISRLLHTLEFWD